MEHTQFKDLMWIIITVLIVAACQGQNTSTDDEYTNGEKKLLKELFVGYNPALRPVKNHSHAVWVEFGAALYTLNNLNENDHTLSTTLLLRMFWRDEFLTWDPSKYGGVSAIRIHPSKVWQPDIVPFNSQAEVAQMEKGTLNAVLYNTGEVLIIPRIHLLTSCQINMRNYPFDQQTCTLVFGSWTYDGYTMKLHRYGGKDELDLNDYTGNLQWDIVNNTGNLHSIYYQCCPEPYETLKYNLTLRRRPSYQAYKFMGPGVGISLLIPLMFIVPAHSLQKIPLGVGLAVCLVLLLNMLDNSLPQSTSSTPMLAIHYVSSLIILCISLGLNAFIANFTHRGSRTDEPPELLKKVFLKAIRPFVFVCHDLAKDTENLLPSQTFAAEWEIIGLVIDRLLFVIFSLIMIAECIAVLG